MVVHHDVDGGGHRVREDGDHLGHAVEYRPAELHVGCRLGLLPAALGGLRVASDKLRPDQSLQATDGELRGLREDDRLDRGEDVRIDVGPASVDLLSDRADPGPVELTVSQRRSRLGKPVDQAPRHRGQPRRLAAGAVHDHGELVREELGDTVRQATRGRPGG
jgi:hypothetical protein